MDRHRNDCFTNEGLKRVMEALNWKYENITTLERRRKYGIPPNINWEIPLPGYGLESSPSFYI